MVAMTEPDDASPLRQGFECHSARRGTHRNRADDGTGCIVDHRNGAIATQSHVDPIAGGVEGDPKGMATHRNGLRDGVCKGVDNCDLVATVSRDKDAIPIWTNGHSE